jgi:hypothetical protein
MSNINELIDDLKRRINPGYQDMQGTESYERRLCVEALESLQAENLGLKNQRDELLEALTNIAKESKEDPVAWMYEDCIYWEGCGSLNAYIRQNGKPLYTYPPKRQPLSDDEITDLWLNVDSKTKSLTRDFARAIEKAHGIGEKE